jgi:hypothetical protein
MAPRLTARTAFVVRRPRTEAEWTGFLDMLRYDQPTVNVAYHDVVVLVTPPGRHPTTERWASFGLHVLARTDVDRDGIVPSALVTWAREKVAPTFPASVNRHLEAPNG